MNETQKRVLGLGLIVMAATALVAPYRWTAVDSIASLTVRPGFQRHGTTYAPVWADPEKLTDDVTRAVLFDKRRGWVLERVEVSLQVGLLGLWWAAIAAATTVGVLLQREPGQ